MNKKDVNAYMDILIFWVSKCVNHLNINFQRQSNKKDNKMEFHLVNLDISFIQMKMVKLNA